MNKYTAKQEIETVKIKGGKKICLKKGQWTDLDDPRGMIFPIQIINEDGTSSGPPANPLLDKWNAMIPDKYGIGKQCAPYEQSEGGGVIANYSCVLCHEKSCHYSDSFEIPEEDKEIYEKWLADVDEFDRIHNPELWSLKHGDGKAANKIIENVAAML